MTAIDPSGQSSADDGLVAKVRGAAAAELARRLGPARLFTPSEDDQALVWSVIAEQLADALPVYLAVVVGLPRGILMARFRPVEHFFLPLASALMPIATLLLAVVLLLAEPLPSAMLCEVSPLVP